MTTDLDLEGRIERLVEIKEEMLELLSECHQLTRGTSEEDRARSYWLAHIRCALDDEHQFLGGSVITMQDTINGLQEFDELHQDD